MRIRLLAVGSGCVLAVCLVLGVLVEPASAQAPSEQGWWAATNPGPPPGLATAPQPPAAPDVPPNGLLIEGGSSASSPTAYAALVYELPPGAAAVSMTLVIAPNSATTPNATLEICPLTQPTLDAEQGGPMSDAPAYSCTEHQDAQETSNGSVYQFPVSSLTSDGALAVAILPTSPTDRVVLSQPGTDSVTAQSGSSPAQDGTVPPGAVGALGGQSLSFSPIGSAGLNSIPVLGAQAVAPSQLNSQAVPATNRPGTARSGPTSNPAAVAVPIIAADSPARPFAVGLLILLAIAGVAAWSGAGHAAVRSVALNHESESGD